MQNGWGWQASLFLVVECHIDSMYRSKNTICHPTPTITIKCAFNQSNQNQGEIKQNNDTHQLPNAISFLISWIALAGFKPLGQVLEQLRMVWHRYRLMLLSSISFLSAWRSSRESLSQRYDCRRIAGPRYCSLFHQYDGQDVEQHAQRMHS